MNTFEEFKNGLDEAGITEETLQNQNVDIIGKVGEEIEAKFKLEEEIAFLQSQLAEKEKLLKEYDQIKIPQLLEAAGLAEITTKSGFKVTTKNEYRGNISEANSEVALEWFIKSGGADTVKNSYIIPVSINDKVVAEQLEKILNKAGLDYSRKLNIPWNTLAGVIKELDVTNNLDNNKYFEDLKKDKGLPSDLTLSKVLGVYKYKTTKVQSLKTRSNT